jgi:hypothetical protein
MARLFGDEGQQQQLQIVRRQLAAARQAAVVGKSEAARTAAAAMVRPRATRTAVPVMRPEPGVLVPMVVVVMGMMVVWHDRLLIS